MKLSFPTLILSSFFGLVVLFPLNGMAETVVAVTSKASVSTDDLLGEGLRLSPEERKEAFSKVEAVSQAASNLAIRRTFAVDAQAAGLENDPSVQAALRIARDRVLSDALFRRMNAANKPKPEVLDALALATYRADPKRFEMPGETRARHILIKRETPDAYKAAAEILVQLKAGADFERMASQRSEDPGSAAKGGDLGYFRQGRMVAPFDAAVAKLERPSDLSEVVETQFGYHIIKLDDRRSQGIRPYAEVKDVLRRELESKVLNDARLAEVERIRAGIQLNQAALEDFAASNK